MPTTVVGTPFSVRVRPISVRSAPKRRFQRPSPIIATGAALGFSSSSVNARPATGGTPSTRVSAGLMRLPESCSGSPAPVSVTALNPTAASSSNVCVCSRHERKFSPDAPKLGRLSLSFFSATCISRVGSAKGNGRRSTALTTLKMAVLAAIARATVRTMAAVNIGVRRIMRVA